jgi:hypothetical protein
MYPWHVAFSFSKRKHASFINCCGASVFLFLAVIVVFSPSKASFPPPLFSFYSYPLVHKPESSRTLSAMFLKHSAPQCNIGLLENSTAVGRPSADPTYLPLLRTDLPRLRLGLVQSGEAQVAFPRQPLHLPRTINWWRPHKMSSPTSAWTITVYCLAEHTAFVSERHTSSTARYTVSIVKEFAPLII